MKKIPTLFKRDFDNHRVIGISNELSDESLGFVLKGEGEATVKWDGSCTAIIDGIFYRRYDAKLGKDGKQKKIPEGAIPCQDEPDPVTGHMPCWVRVKEGDPSDKWFMEAYKNSTEEGPLSDGTYEACGPHFQTNPHNLEKDILIRHGIDKIAELNTGKERTYEEIRAYLETHIIEGIVFWKDSEPRCKIKRRDFGYKWK